VLIVGAKGHAKELLDIIEKNKIDEKIYFFDDISKDAETKLYGKYPILRNFQEIDKIDSPAKIFALGIGTPKLRFLMAQKLKNLGWRLTSIISNTAQIANHNVILGDGINVMHNAFISNDVTIGEGSLINANTMVHHDVSIGKFCEISPGSCLTGGVKVGDFSFIGAGSVIIPKVIIGNYCIIGAGSVVTKDIPEQSVAVGVPARVIKKTSPQDLPCF
jgi:sugar O-acyltransferase (sialic acid O-acetyltransferase NeuD family)